MFEITIREAENSELSIIQRMCSDTISAVCKKDYNNDQIKVWVSGIENTERWNNNLSDQYLLVAEFKDEIIGFISLKDGFYIDFYMSIKITKAKELLKTIYGNRRKSNN